MRGRRGGRGRVRGSNTAAAAAAVTRGAGLGVALARSYSRHRRVVQQQGAACGPLELCKAPPREARLGQCARRACLGKGLEGHGDIGAAATAVAAAGRGDSRGGDAGKGLGLGRADAARLLAGLRRRLGLVPLPGHARQVLHLAPAGL